MGHRLSTVLLAAGLAGTPAQTAAQPHDWTGLYAGITGTNAFASAAQFNDYLGNGGVIYTSGIRFEQAFLGARLGHNFNPIAGLVMGIEADLAFANTGYSTTPSLEQGLPSPSEDLYNISSMWSTRARIGKPMGNLLPYIAGGIAGARMRTGWDNVPANQFFGRGSGTAIGFTIGGGLEYALAPNLRLHTGYRFTDFGTTHITVREPDGFESVFEVDLHTHSIVFGTSWVFGSLR